TPTEDATEPLADRLPTINVPTFTPVGSRFGDSGITPTANLPTQPIPDALITPTALATEVDECTYIVQANDTLFSIASQLETEVDAMVAANPALAANPDALSIGQPLAVPNCEDDTEATAASTAEATSEARAAQTEDPESEDGDDDVRTEDDAPAAPDGQQVHVVQQGENLFRIALQYNVSVDAIVVANPSLSSQATIIQPGQELIIPAP
ncbi:MAG: LysM peptidoglycan-binding domain-containing protein, partial [Anaerolineales bacterium]